MSEEINYEPSFILQSSLDEIGWQIKLLKDKMFLKQEELSVCEKEMEKLDIASDKIKLALKYVKHGILKEIKIIKN